MSRTTLLSLIGFMAIFGGLPLYWWAVPPRLPIGTANGTYANPCCGSVKLEDGQLGFGQGQIVSYVVERDKVGRYVLPSAYIGVWNSSAVQANKAAYPLKLRLDDSIRPKTIELFSKSAVVDFERVGGNHN